MNNYTTHSQDMNSWARERGGDLPYWYAKEETNIGFLAAAVWRLGGAALQEFEVTRQDGKGQADLWFNLDGLSCHVEAKGADSPSTSRDAVDRALAEAKSQLEVEDNERAPIQMVLCFVAPAVRGSSFEFRELVRQFESDDMVVAIYLPHSSVNTLYDDGYTYPGIALIGQIVTQPRLPEEQRQSG